MNTDFNVDEYGLEVIDRLNTPKSLLALNHTARSRAETALERVKATVAAGELHAADAYVNEATTHHLIAAESLTRIEYLKVKYGGTAWRDTLLTADAHTAHARYCAHRRPRDLRLTRQMETRRFGIRMSRLRLTPTPTARSPLWCWR